MSAEAKVPTNLLALAEELNEKAHGWKLSLRSEAGQKDWYLEVRRGFGWPGEDLAKLTEIAKTHKCALGQIDQQSNAYLRPEES